MSNQKEGKGKTMTMTSKTQNSSSTITVEKVGRRYYIGGNTYPIRKGLRDAGCHWDAERRQWWHGKKDVAERFAGKKVSNYSSNVQSKRIETKVLAKCEYKGRKYYATWIGRTRKGSDAARLVFMDGSKEFWASLEDVTIIKRYGWEDDCTGKIRYPTIKSLKEYAKQAQKAKEKGYTSPRAMAAERSGVCRMPGCGGTAVPGNDGMCDSCYFDEYDN